MNGRVRKLELLKQIQDAQRELEDIEIMEHNDGVNGAVKHFREELLERATPAELKFLHVAKLKGLRLTFQCRINIYKGKRIEKVYYADFCDWKNKLIFEVDGEYHNDEEQKIKDSERTKDLQKCGFKVFRISNQDVFDGKTTALLYKAYKSIGISII